MAKPEPELNVLSRAPQAGAAIPPPASRWKTRVLLPALILLAFASLLGFAARDSLWPAVPVKIVPVVARNSAGSSGGVSFQAAGWVEPDPYITHVSALTDGIVKELFALEGQKVKAGELVARLVDDDAKLALAHAQSQLAAATAALKAAQQDWENPVERKRAIQLSEAELAEAQAELYRLDAEIAMESARAEELKQLLDREKRAGDALPGFQALQTELKLKTQQAALEFAKQRKPVLQATVKKKEAEHHAAKEAFRLRIAEAHALDGAKAATQTAEVAVAVAQLRLARTELRAPADGIVVNPRAAPGAKLLISGDDRHSSVALDLYDPKRLQVRVDVPISESASVTIGQLARITSEASGERVFNGKVTRIVHEADIQKNTLQIKVAIDNPTEELKPEMLARVQFVAQQRAASTGAASSAMRIFAPESCLQRSGTQATAWIVDKGNSAAQQRTVVLGFTRFEGWIEITSGLQPGDQVIAGDTAALREGTRVKVTGEATVNAGTQHHTPAPSKAKDGDHD